MVLFPLSLQAAAAGILPRTLHTLPASSKAVQLWGIHLLPLSLPQCLMGTEQVQMGKDEFLGCSPEPGSPHHPSLVTLCAHPKPLRTDTLES